MALVVAIRVWEYKYSCYQTGVGRAGWVGDALSWYQEIVVGTLGWDDGGSGGSWAIALSLTSQVSWVQWWALLAWVCIIGGGTHNSVEGVDTSITCGWGGGSESWTSLASSWALVAGVVADGCVSGLALGTSLSIAWGCITSSDCTCSGCWCSVTGGSIGWEVVASSAGSTNVDGASTLSTVGDWALLTLIVVVVVVEVVVVDTGWTIWCGVAGFAVSWAGSARSSFGVSSDLPEITVWTSGTGVCWWAAAASGHAGWALEVRGLVVVGQWVVAIDGSWDSVDPIEIESSLASLANCGGGIDSVTVSLVDADVSDQNVSGCAWVAFNCWGAYSIWNTIRIGFGGALHTCGTT